MDMDVRNEAVKLFNRTWDLLDVPAEERSDQQNADMLCMTHASRYLWGLVGEPVNRARGDWQVSHVYAVLGYGHPALLFGKQSLDTVLELGISGMDLAFGYEAVARAYAVLNDNAAAQEYKSKGMEAALTVMDEADRKYVKGELDSIRC